MAGANQSVWGNELVEMQNAKLTDSKAIGIDLGGTKINAGVVDQNGAILHSVKQDTPIEAGGSAIVDAIHQIVASLSIDDGLLPVGIASPGLIDFENGTVLACTPNLPDWLGRNLKVTFQERLHRPVVVENDARAAAWGEYCLGKGRGTQNYVLLTLGTGLGSGIVMNRNLVRNAMGFGIGFGHMIVNSDGRFCNCGQQGCLEAYVSGKGLMASYQELGGSSGIKGPEIFQLAEAGNGIAQQTIDAMLDMLAVGIVNIFNTLAPEIVVLGGGMSSQGEEKLRQPLLKKIETVMKAPLHHPDIIQLATLGEHAGMIGAALLASESTGLKFL